MKDFVRQASEKYFFKRPPLASNKSKRRTAAKFSTTDLISKFIDETWYKNNYTDVDFSTTDAATHYLSVGASEGRSPHPLFDVEWYMQRFPELQGSGANPLVHLLTNGDKGVSANPLFDGHWYLATNPDVRHAGIPAMQHYVEYGATEQRCPHPLFDVVFYREANNIAADDNVLLHYLQNKGINPHPLFNDEYYLNQVPKLGYSGINALVHFLLYGAAHGYNPNKLFDCYWYVRNHETLSETGENPLVHFVCTGSREGRDPHPLFDIEWYLFKNPDVAQNGMEPLTHYLTSGEAQERAVRPPDASSETCAVLDIPYEIRRNPTSLTGRDVCVFVTYSPDGALAPHVRLHVDALRANDVGVILVIATDGLDQLLPSYTQSLEGVVVRTNHGWDFGCWAAVLTAVPEVWSARTVILTNDSIFGPTDPNAFSALLARIRASTADFVALTDSFQVKPHYMSYFLALKRNALTSTRVRDFWSNVRSIQDKDCVIYNYEIESKKVISEAHLKAEVLFPTRKRFDRDINPTLTDWRGLLLRGFPFVKVQLLRDHMAEINTDGWRELLSGNAQLLLAIDSHLKSVERKLGSSGDQAPSQRRGRRPIPVPRKHYKRSNGFATSYGAVQSTRPTERTDLCLEVPFRSPVLRADLPDRVAVIAHIFYPEMCAEIRRYLGNIPTRADLFVSTDTIAKKKLIEQNLSGWSGTVEVKVFPNIGRDIAPMLIGFASVFKDYDFFLHIHSKRSPHDLRLASWRSHLLSNLLGSDDVVASILTLLMHTETGIVCSDHYGPVRTWLNWGGNYNKAGGILQRLGIALSKDFVLDFPSSSFFWGRCDAMRPLVELGLDWNDFDVEAGQTDGTLAHAIERIILYVAEAKGYAWSKVGQTSSVSADRLVPAWSPDDVTRVHRRLLGNRLPPLVEHGLTPELVSVCARPDRRNLRPRLNLIIPTLSPGHFFGGITTAIRIFEEIAAELQPDYDFRIICQTICLDLESMLGFPDYLLVRMDSQDNFPKVIVDISDQGSGQLTVRSKDVFLATAWWTAVTAFDLQKKQYSYFGREQKILYLIQDHEPDFYGWSSQYSMAQHTYSQDSKMIALINSEELAEFMKRQYVLSEAYVVRFKVNPKIAASFKHLPRERIICIYGRPGTPRNAFPVLCAGISRWQQNAPSTAQNWQIISAGEDFSLALVGSIKNFSVVGKLSLGAYGELLSKASVGISLMLSPHPSYPPLEMASAGLCTVTNAFATKDLSLRSPNVISIPFTTADAVAEALEQATGRAEACIGRPTDPSPINDLPCSFPDFDAAVLARSIRRMVAQ